MPDNPTYINRIYAGSNRFVGNDELADSRANALERLARGGGISITDENIDNQWARLHKYTKAPKSYFDYYFSGTDIRAYISELGDDTEFGDMPILGIAYSVEQQKMPLYGFWSYSYDAMLRGTRLISGQILIAPKYPGYMRSALAAAAAARSERALNELQDPYPRAKGITDDDRNIDKYWTRHLDPSALVQGMNEYSVHPPFNLSIIFGIQNTSVDQTLDQFTDQLDYYQNDTALFTDHNQRLVEGFNSDLPSRYILEACELTGMQTAYQDDQIVVEKYSFLARDIVVPPARDNDVQSSIPAGVIRGPGQNIDDTIDGSGGRLEDGVVIFDEE